MRRNGKLVVAIAVVHLLASVVSAGVAFGETMRIFDDPLGGMSLLGRFAGGAARVLLLPARWLWTPWASQTLGDGVEWLLVGLNSLLWGYALEAASRWVRTRL